MGEGGQNNAFIYLFAHYGWWSITQCKLFFFTFHEFVKLFSAAVLYDTENH